MSAPDAAPAAEQLPRPVLSKMVSLVAEVLPDVKPLPAPLRKVAAFAPARRSRLGASAITRALDEDEFRRRVETLVRARNPGPADELERAEPGQPPSGDPVELAAHCWLHRPQGWQSLLAGLLELVDLGRGTEAVTEQEVVRIGERLAAAEQSLRDVRAEHRAKLAQVKEENTELRRKLGETRSALRLSRAEAEEATAARDLALADVDRVARQAEAEARRMRAKVEQLTRELQGARRETRAGRDETTIRARLLLDTVIDAASGLRRELALPAAEGLPADSVQVASESPASGQGASLTSSPDGPELLERLLALPRARLLVDGYNVSKAGWPSSSLEAQRIRLLSALAPVVARTGAETTVVFDAHSVDARPVVGAPRGVRVVFSPKGVIADDVLRQFVDAEPSGRVVVVVTSDQELARDLRRGGARVVPSPALLQLMTP